MFFGGKCFGSLRRYILLGKRINPSRSASVSNESIGRINFRRGMYALFKRYVQEYSSRTYVKVDDYEIYNFYSLTKLYAGGHLFPDSYGERGFVMCNMCFSVWNIL